MADRVLDLRRGHAYIEQAHELAEFDLIVLEPSWLFRSDTGAAVPDHDFLHLLHANLLQRTGQLEEFLLAGGVFVVTLEAPATADLGIDIHYSSYDWWLPTLPFEEADLGPSALLESGVGETALVLAKDHPYGHYLQVHRRYEGRLVGDVTRSDAVTVLAENRRKQAVAAEVRVGPGLVVLVPPPGDEEGRELLLVAGTVVEHGRRGRRQRWHLSIEARLEAELEAATAEYRRQVEDASTQLRRAQEVRNELLGQEVIQRAIRHYEQAVEGTPSPKRSLPPLFKLHELVEDRYGGEARAARVLGLPRADLERIRRLANQGRFDVRHDSKSERVVDVPAEEFKKALDTGAAIVRQILDHEAEHSLSDQS